MVTRRFNGHGLTLNCMHCNHIHTTKFVIARAPLSSKCTTHAVSILVLEVVYELVVP